MNQPASLAPVITYLAATTGIQLPDTLYRPVEQFVDERCEAFKCGAGEYTTLLSRDRQEYARFIDAVTVNETYFFREEGQFRILEKSVLPALSLEPGVKKIWSSSCSSGEEPLSLFSMASKIIGRDHFMVYASDINENVLSHFARGFYKGNSFRSDGKSFHHLIENCGTRDERGFQVDGAVLEAITRVETNINNLPSEKLPLDFNVIFFRNTIIYFNLAERQRIIGGLLGHMKEGGYLFTSITEVALIAHPDLVVESIDDVYFFRKKSVAQKSEGMVVRAPLLEKMVLDRESGQAEKNITGERIDIGTVLAMANQKLNNGMFHLPVNVNYPVAIDLLELLYFLNTENPKEASLMLVKLSPFLHAHEVFWYLKARLDLIENRIDESLRDLTQSLEKNQSFWPARFSRALALITLKSHARARSDFSRCISDIEAYISGGEFAYQIFMEGFNGRYFITICEGWLTKISDQD